MSGQIVDATLVPAPKQRNSEDEKKAIKAGRIPEGWAENPPKLRQKDRDARWTVKFSKAKERPDGTKPPIDIAIPAFGYQNHIAIDKGFGFIRKMDSDRRRRLRRRAAAREPRGRGEGERGASVLSQPS